MYAQSVPVMSKYLGNLSTLLDKAQAHCAANKIDFNVLLESRLFPDMFPLSRQIRIAADFAKGGSARLAGIEVPVFEDNEKTLDEFKARIKKTQDFLATLKPEQFAGADTRIVKIKIAGNDKEFIGEPYLNGFVLPNFYFHLTTAYNILRHNGVPLGKADFVGGF